jgi:GNAT superfamily N-acetyltransferase
VTPILAPVALTEAHNGEAFACGEPSLDAWLKKRALRSQGSGGARCFVIAHGPAILGYYCLSAGAISHEAVPKPMRRNMPNPLPVLLLGRLAIDRRYHNQGLGSALLRDAMLRAAAVSTEAGVSAILLHALTEAARQFYLSRGFSPSPLQPMTLMMSLATVRAILAE